MKESVRIDALGGPKDQVLKPKKVQLFVDQVRWALADGQTINVSALIPPQLEFLINLRLTAVKKPEIANSSINDLLANLLFLARGPQSAREEPKREEEFFEKSPTSWVSTTTTLRRLMR